jgi:acyl-CoA thioester hydrolase
MKHKTPIQIRFKDVDKLGHVNNANHITYFELARVDYFNALMGDNIKIDWYKESLILAKIEMEYKMPILLEDKVFVYTWVSAIGTKSFTMNCSIVKATDAGEIVCAEGLAIIVCFNYETNKTIPVPDNWKAKMIEMK